MLSRILWSSKLTLMFLRSIIIGLFFNYAAPFQPIDIVGAVTQDCSYLVCVKYNLKLTKSQYFLQNSIKILPAFYLQFHLIYPDAGSSYYQAQMKEFCTYYIHRQQSRLKPEVRYCGTPPQAPCLRFCN